MQHAFLPEGEHVRRAVRWLADSRLGDDTRTALELVGEACLRFDLSPLEEEWMLRTFTSYAPAQSEAASETPDAAAPPRRA